MRGLLLVVVVLALGAGCVGHRMTIRTTPEEARVLVDGAVVCEKTPCEIDDVRAPGADVRVGLETKDARWTLVVPADRFDGGVCASRACAQLCGGVLAGGLCVGVGLAAGPLGFVAGPLGVPVPGVCGAIGGGCMVLGAVAGAAASPLSSFTGPDAVDVDLERGVARASPEAPTTLERTP